MPADLMIAVNPASDSILARQMITALYSRKNRKHATAICLDNINGGLGNGHIFPDRHRVGVNEQRFQQGPGARSGQYVGNRAQLLYLDTRP